MADPLCRWHYALPKNVVEIVRALPKTEMPKEDFLAALRLALSAGGYSFDFATFQKTAYQLAVQLGLYYIDDADVYHPRFDCDIDENTAARYLAVVARCYVAPNPYTNVKSFGNGQLPVNLYSALVGYASAIPKGAPFEVNDALGGHFSASLGNPDAVTALMAAAPVFTKVGSKTLSYSPVLSQDMNKQEFFNLFSWPNSSDAPSKQSLTDHDILRCALECFRRERASAKAPAGWTNFDAWAKAARVAFDGIDETKATDPNFDYPKFMREFAISVQVANTKFARHSVDEKAAVLKFLHEQQINPQLVTWYLDGVHRPQVNGEDVKGMGVTATFFFMMELHPTLYASWSDMTFDSLVRVGLHKGPVPAKLTLQSYDDCKAKQCQVLAKMKELGIGKAADDPSDADYITVNEFLWFVKDQFKEIQNEVMNMSLETPTNETNPGNKEWKDVLSENPDDMMNRLVAALLTKPFAILAGASGTGKSRMVRKLAYMTCLNKQLQPDPQTKKPIENFRMVQVKPNWHDSTELLGYRSSVSGTHEYVSTDFVRFVLKAHAFPNTPFFVCLDEMNLAPVEHYFAEFLSASESARVEDGEYITDPIVDPGEFDRNIANLDPQGYSIPAARKDLIEKRGLYLPKNLFVVGTVNMDDTTGGFSRKVLDRAMTIEMNEVNFDELQKPVELRLEDKVENGVVLEKGLLLKEPQITSFINRVEFKPDNFDDGLKGQLEDVRSKLATTPLAFAFRFARECVQYRDALKLLFPDDPATGKTHDHTGFALDHMFLMKILPRLVGNIEERQGVVDKLKAFFSTLAGHSVSAGKLQFMLDASETNGGFLSYYM